MRFRTWLVWSLTLIMIAGGFACACSNAPREPKVLATIDTSGMQGEGIIQASPRTGYVYVGCSGQTAIIKGTKIMSVLSTGIARCDAMAADKTDGWVYALSTYSDTVTVIRETQVITALETIGHGPMAMTVAPNGWVYVVSGYRRTTGPGEDPVEGNIMAISGTRVIGNLTLGRALLTHIVADPITDYIYVSGILKNEEDIIVLQGLKEIERHAIVGGMIYAMDIDPRTGEVYVLSADGLTRFKEGHPVDSLHLEYPYQAIRVQPKTGDVYLSAGSHGSGQVLVVHDMKLLAKVAVGGQAIHMEADPVTGNVFVVNSEDNTVTVIQGTEAIATIPVGSRPSNVGVKI